MSSSSQTSSAAQTKCEAIDRLREALRAAIRARLPGHDRADEGLQPSLRDVARAVVESVRWAPVPSEAQLMTALRELWESLPELRVLAPGAQRQAILDHVVSLSIEEFYRPRGG